MRLILSLFLIVSMLGNIQSQHKEVTGTDTLTFTGKVYDRETLQVLGSTAYVVNNRMYVADKQGRFRFSASEGDTIVFHHVGYNNLLLVVEDSISNEEYLTGIFLSPDMVQLSEVLVVPRYYDIETLVKTTPVDYADIQIAEKNMKMSAYQGLMPNTNWDAETNQKYALQKEALRVKYKGMVAPDQMFGANLVTVIPEAMLTYGVDKVPQVDLGAISTQEEEYLVTVFDAIRKEKEKNQKQLNQNSSPFKQVEK